MTSALDISESQQRVCEKKSKCVCECVCLYTLWIKVSLCMMLVYKGCVSL